MAQIGTESMYVYGFRHIVGQKISFYLELVKPGTARLYVEHLKESGYLLIDIKLYNVLKRISDGKLHRHKHFTSWDIPEEMINVIPCIMLGYGYTEETNPTADNWLQAK